MANGLALRGSSGSDDHRGLFGSILHGAGGLAGNLAGDVKDAAVGFFPGLKDTVIHPVRSAENIAKSEWSMYSPLFAGNFGQFANNVYDHPLAPLLDVATVFSLGIGGAAKLGETSKAAEGTILGKAAKLRLPKTQTLTSPKGGLDYSRQLSTKPARRLAQEAIEPYLPNWYRDARYDKYARIDTSHRVAAKNRMLDQSLANNAAITTTMLAGKALSDAVAAPRARSELAAGLYLNLHRHAAATLTPEEWEAIPADQRAHLRLVKDASLMDTTHRTLLRQLHKSARRARKSAELAGHAIDRVGQTILRWDAHRKASAEAASSLKSLREEHARLNEQLRKMYDEGYRVAGGATTKLKEPTERQRMEYEAGPLIEVQKNIARVEKEITKARVAKKVHTRATAQLTKLVAHRDELTSEKHAHLARATQLLNDRQELQHRSYVDYFQHVGESHEAFEHFAENFGRQATTRHVEDAAITHDGKVRVVPIHDAHNLGHELKNSSAFVTWLWRKPTRLWKMALLGYTPRIITNNAVGNWAIHAVREENPLIAVRTVYDAVKFSKGRKEAHASLKASVPFESRHWMHKYFGNELGNVFSHELEAQGLKSKAAQGLYPIVHKVADEPVRVAAIYAALRHSPEVKAFTDRGLSFDMAAARALRTTPALRQRVAEHARTVAGDYFTISNHGRAVRDLIPFYLWDRHIMKTTGNLFADNPGRVAVMQRIGQEGVAQNEQWLGELPDFLHGVIPFGVKNGRADVLLTASLNPFASVAELAGAAQAVTTGGGPRPGEAILSQVNPIASGAVQFLTGENPMTGAPVKTHGGLVSDVAIQLGESLPGTRLVTESLGGERTVSDKGNPLLFRHGPIEQITSIFGVPIRSVDLMAAADQARREKGITGSSGGAKRLLALSAS